MDDIRVVNFKYLNLKFIQTLLQALIAKFTGHKLHFRHNSRKAKFL
jgi:hypothetical protein